MPPLLIRPAAAGDAHALWEWRNDAHTRAMFKNADHVEWEAHAHWFEKALANPDCILYIGTLHGEPVGVCRFDCDAATNLAEISLNLNPAQRGKGLSHALLSGAIRLFRETHTQPLQASIKKENLASIACFTQCGFALTREDANYHYYLYP